MELKLEGIQKSYQKKHVCAVKDFSMCFMPGVYGLLGPNGAGKSTLMNIITDNLKADKGTITWNGTPVQKLGADYRSVLGYMPQQQNLYDDFTGEQFLWYMSSLKGLKKKAAREKIEELLVVVNLVDERYKKIKSYSGGMKQRLLIAQALLNDPQILIMDEPTAGLDPKERVRIRNFISSISKDRIVLLATHIVSDVENIAKEIILMQKGEIIKIATPRKLVMDMQDKVFEVLVTEAEQEQYESEGYKISNIMLGEEKNCLRIVSKHIPTLGQVQKVQANLEDVYLFLED